jgi:hypothetical protein
LPGGAAGNGYLADVTAQAEEKNLRVASGGGYKWNVLTRAVIHYTFDRMETIAVLSTSAGTM